MTITKTEIEGLLVITPRIFSDERGLFFESFNQAKFEQAVGRNVQFVQDNESVSHKNVLRGLHFQLPPKAQGKLVRVVRGAVLDVAVDLRSSSPTFGKHFSIELSSENRKQLWIPAGFAHGFLSLADETVFAYKCDEYYAPEYENGLLWSDPDLAISWGIDNPVISPKDSECGLFANFNSPF